MMLRAFLSPRAPLFALLSLVGCNGSGCDRDQRNEAASVGTPSPSTRTPSARTVSVSPGLLDAGRVRTAPVTRRKPTGAVRLPADVVATPEGASEAGTLLAGRIARFESREGDTVKRGQVLAWLDAPEAARAVSDFVRARARTETQSRKVTRLEGLVASEAASLAALDEARLELDLARADFAAARTLIASLGLAEPAAAPEGRAPAILAQLPVRSPVDGVVVERNAALGAHVTPDTRLFRLVSEGRVLVEARLADGADVVLTTSDRAYVQRRGGERCTARVLGVLPQVEASTRSRKVRLALEGACSGLTPGAQVEVEIEVPARAASGGGSDDVLVVPARSALEMKSTMIVFVKGAESGVFEVRPIEPGLRIGDDLVVVAGVEEGEEVASDGAILLKGELMRSELGGEE